MFSQLQTLRLYAGDAFAAFSNSFFQTSLDFLPIMKAYLELVHGRFERIETLTEHSNVEKRFKEILGNARFRIKRPGQPTLPNPDQLPKDSSIAFSATKPKAAARSECGSRPPSRRRPR